MCSRTHHEPERRRQGVTHYQSRVAGLEATIAALDAIIAPGGTPSAQAEPTKQDTPAPVAARKPAKRAKVVKKIADLVFSVTGKNPLLEIALELERIALQDEYFISRKLYPNVDFYSGLIYQAMGFPVEMFPVLFAIPRTAGWIAQWEEMLLDPEQKIARPRQIYIGAKTRDYVPREQRA